MQHEAPIEDPPRTSEAVVAEWLVFIDNDSESAARYAYCLGLVRSQARIVLRDIDDDATDVMVKWNRDLLRELLDRLQARLDGKMIPKATGHGNP